MDLSNLRDIKGAGEDKLAKEQRHKQSIGEAKLDNAPTVNAQIESNKLVTNLNGFIASPTYAYSSGEEIVTQEQGAATVTQTWTLS